MNSTKSLPILFDDTLRIPCVENTTVSVAVSVANIYETASQVLLTGTSQNLYMFFLKNHLGHWSGNEFLMEAWKAQIL